MNNYINDVDLKMAEYMDSIEDIFQMTEQKLDQHFDAFLDRVRAKFEKEILHKTIKSKFDSISPLKQRTRSPAPQPLN